MDKLVIQSLKSVSFNDQILKFNSKRQYVRKILDSDFEVFKRNEFALNTTDFYMKYSLFVEYNQKDCFEAIELTNLTNVIVTIKNITINKLSYSKMISVLDNISKSNKKDDIGVNYYDLGIGISKSYEDDKFESILIFSEDYWGNVSD